MRRFKTILKEFRTIKSSIGIYADFPLLDVFKSKHKSFESLMNSVFGSKGMEKYFIDKLKSMKDNGNFVKNYEKTHKDLKLIIAQKPMEGNENEWLRMYLFENVLRTIRRKIDINTFSFGDNGMKQVIQAIDEVYKKFKDRFNAKPKRSHRIKRLR